MKERLISIRRFSRKGSEAQTYTLAEAERVAAEAWKRGSLLVDEDKDESIREITPEVSRILIVDPIAGG